MVAICGGSAQGEVAPRSTTARASVGRVMGGIPGGRAAGGGGLSAGGAIGRRGGTTVEARTAGCPCQGWRRPVCVSRGSESRGRSDTDEAVRRPKPIFRKPRTRLIFHRNFRECSAGAAAPAGPDRTLQTDRVRGRSGSGCLNAIFTLTKLFYLQELPSHHWVRRRNSDRPSLVGRRSRAFLPGSEPLGPRGRPDSDTGPVMVSDPGGRGSRRAGGGRGGDLGLGGNLALPTDRSSRNLHLVIISGIAKISSISLGSFGPFRPTVSGPLGHADGRTEVGAGRAAKRRPTWDIIVIGARVVLGKSRALARDWEEGGPDSLPSGSRSDRRPGCGVVRRVGHGGRRPLMAAPPGRKTVRATRHPCQWAAGWGGFARAVERT